MQKLVWQNSLGDEIDLTSTPYGITTWEGFSNTSLNIQNQQVPFQDGGVFLDALMEQRELAVTLAIQDNNNLENRYRYRRELIHILNPKLGEGYLIYINDFISKRIKCIPQIPLFETHNSNDSGTPKATLAWTACEPYWEDLEETVLEEVDGSSITINNEGDIEAGLKIEMFGVVKNPIIKILETEKKIKYNDDTQGYLTINTNVGKKEVLGAGEDLTFYTVRPDKNKILYSHRLKNFILYSNYDNIAYTTSGGSKYNRNIIKITDVSDGEINFIKEVNGKFFISYTENNINYLAIGEDLFGEADSFYIITTSEVVKDVIYSDSRVKYIAVGESGFISVSDGESGVWNTVTSGTSYNLNAVIDSKIANKIICVGDNNTVITSEDCTTWQIQSTSSSDYSNDSIAEGNGVILTSNCKSYDGATWVDYQDSWKLNNIVFIKYLSLFSVNEGAFVTITGDVFTQAEFPEDTGGAIIAVNEEENIILGAKSTDSTIGWYGVKKSYNAINWEVASLEYMPTNIVKKGDYFYGCIRIPSVGFVIAKTVDLIKWEKILDVDNDPYLAYRYIIKLCNNNIIIWWYNGNWEQQTTTKSGCVVSSDGENWNQQVFTTPLIRITDVTYFEKTGKYISVGYTQSNAVILQSNDLNSWDIQDNVYYSRFNGVASSSDEVCIIAMEGVDYFALRSTDGTDFESIVLPTFSYTYSLSEMVYSKAFQKFYIIGVYNTGEETKSLVLSSKDGAEYSIIYSSLYRTSHMCNSDLGNKLIITSYDNYGRQSKIVMCYDGINFEEIEIIDNYMPFAISSINEDGYGGFILYQSMEIYKISISVLKNEISKLSEDSDMGLYLEQGINTIRVIKESGSCSLRISYRQKYIGV